MNTLSPTYLYDPQIESISDLESLAVYLQERRQSLNQSVLRGAGGLAYAAAYSDLVDAVVRRMFHLACSRYLRSFEPDQVAVCIVATGGYGRRELCPYSDIDITFIPQRDGDSVLDNIIKEMFKSVMRVFIDANNMNVGYAYRLMEDCAKLDHQTASGLLDARLITGSSRLYIQFEHEFWTYFNPADFIFTKQEERRNQKSRVGVISRVVEPNLKEGAGGLRDLQTAVWLTQARRSLASSRVRGDRVWEALIRYSEINPNEAKQLQEAKEFLFRVRNALHVIAGAERDQLVVTRQEQVAEALGYHLTAGTEQDASTQAAKTASRPPVERFMRDFYEHTSVIQRLSETITRRIEESKLVLGIGLDCKRNEIRPANPALACEDPVWMLWACELAQKYGLVFSKDLERAIVELIAANPTIRDQQEAAEIFTRILASPRGAYPILQIMADLGILGWLIPEFGAVMNLIPYDPSHDYTVGQHTLYVIRNLDALRTADGGEENRDFRLLMSELPHPEQLYLAALLHDVGKIDDVRSHSELGEEIAGAICRRLRWSPQATANVQFLIRHHLLMAETSRLRDLHLEETIRDFTAVVDDLDRLHMLYILTYADTSAVGAGVWTAVKGKFLRDLHRQAERVLVGEDIEEVDDRSLSRTRRKLLKELSMENLPPEEIAEHVESMPAPYILNTSLNEMTLHIGFVRRVRSGEPVIEFHDERDSTFTAVTICAQDDPQPGLLAKIAGVLYASDLDVHSAQVYTRVVGDEHIAIDTLYVDFRGRQLTPGKRREVASNMTAVLTGKITVTELLTKKRKPAEIGGPVESLSIRDDVSHTYVMVEVSSTDARATLYRACGAISSVQWDIHSARLSLFKGRFMSCFYVTCPPDQDASQARAILYSLMPAKSREQTL